MQDIQLMKQILVKQTFSETKDNTRVCIIADIIDCKPKMIHDLNYQNSVYLSEHMYGIPNVANIVYPILFNIVLCIANLCLLFMCNILYLHNHCYVHL